jgi:hypothetical protein
MGLAIRDFDKAEQSISLAKTSTIPDYLKAVEVSVNIKALYHMASLPWIGHSYAKEIFIYCWREMTP